MLEHISNTLGKLILAGLWWTGLSLFTPLAAAANESPMVFIYNGPESANDRRYDYHWQVLKAALEKTKSQKNDYIIKPSAAMSETRQTFELTKEAPTLTVMVRDTSVDLESTLVPVKIPIDKGLLGYRLMLIHKKYQPMFDDIRTLNDYKKISIGQVGEWSDVTILRDHGMMVVTNNNYENLFNMLMAGRFNAFSRGVTEIVDEFNSHKADLPDMAIENKTMLYYPLPIYFWFANNEQGKVMAARVEKGMQLMIADGSLDQLFHQHFSPLLKQLNLKNRKLFKIDNPLLPASTPLTEAKYWYNPYKND